MSAAASLGSVLLWDVEGGLPQVDTFLYSEEPLVVAGGLLAVGLINTNVRNDCDPAHGLLYEWSTKIIRPLESVRSWVWVYARRC